MENLAHLSDDELVAQLMEDTSDMRRLTVRQLVRLAEIQRRSLHLLAAASSLFDYCRRFLRMSHGRAYRFSRGAKLCKDYPFLLPRIESGELHLSTLVHIAPFLTAENVEELVAETAGKNREGVDRVLGERFGTARTHGRMGDANMPYDAELLDMMARARELLSHEIPDGDRLAISKLAFGLLITHLENKKRGKTDKPRPAPTKPTKGISRHATRTMFERDGEQCTYVDERTGERCTSRCYIQRDHRRMRVHGGTDDAENLRSVCGPHNLLYAKLALGHAYVEQRIRRRQENEKPDDTEDPQTG